jgi:oligopeptide/dipeptide ABC transporter ATP-binding protein
VRRPLVEVRNLTVTFKNSSIPFGRTRSRIIAVDNVSFDIFESEVLSLVGESGSGKTTVARCLALLQQPTSGSVTIDGKEIKSLRGKNLKENRKNVQIVFQDPYESLYPRFDVFSIISTAIVRLTGQRDRRKIFEEVSSLLTEVGLDPSFYMRRFPHQLSGGERQRVSIAKALASKPRILIADEPTTMLDASQRLMMLALIEKLKIERNLTVLFITHDFGSASLMSDRIAVMYMGKIVEIGRAEEVLKRKHHPYTELILSAVPSLRSDEQGLQDFSMNTGEVVRPAKGCPFHPRCKYAQNKCREEIPVLEEKSADHLAACYFPLSV